NDDSPLVFYCQGGWNSCSLIALDTTKMEILSIKLPEPENNPTTNYWYYIVGVHGGEITVRRKTETTVGDKVEFTFEICKAKFRNASIKFELEAAIQLAIREEREREEEKRRRE
ncbi:hypothetical protein PFISCL1PPCAC_16983, partial [Pristionchus fissidentatus]